MNGCQVDNSTINSDSYNRGINFNNSTISNSNFLLGCCGANFDFLNSTTYNSSFTEYNNYNSITAESSLFVATNFELPSASLTATNSIFVAPTGINYFMNFNTPVLNNSSVIDPNGNSINGLTFSSSRGATVINNSLFQGFESALEAKSYTSTSTSISGNNFIDNINYTIINKQDTDLNCEDNFWGTDDQNVINLTSVVKQTMHYQNMLMKNMKLQTSSNVRC